MFLKNINKLSQIGSFFLQAKKLSSYTSTPIPDIQNFPLRTTPLAIQKIKYLQDEKIKEMRKKYPDILEYQFPQGKIVYRLCNLSPSDMIRQGGFVNHNDLWISNTGTGYTRGFVNFSLLPSVSCLFIENVNKNDTPYLYACYVERDFFAPGGRWPQIIFPGAFTVPKFWVARAIEKITPDRNLLFGEMMGHTEVPNINLDKSFLEFSQSSLQMPKILDLSNEEGEMDFEIIDTQESQEFRNIVREHYKKLGFYHNSRFKCEEREAIRP